MAALLLRRASAAAASSSSLIPVAIRSTGSTSSLIPLAIISPGSCSSPIPLPTRSLGSSTSLHLRNHLFASRFRAFSTSSSNSPSLVTSVKSPPVACGTSYKCDLLDGHGLPFDSVEKDPEHEVLILRKNTKDEIVEIRLEVETERETDDEMTNEESSDDVSSLVCSVKVFFGANFNKSIKAFCHIFPDERISIYEVSFQSGINSEVENVGRKHLDEFEDFFKERGLESCNFNFLFDFIKKQNEIDKVREKVLPQLIT